ncbi:HsdM family class I SAM-dependent methyltransferase [Streptomyces caniscabiei]|uniref:class I SAM-dependent DNA methyltransferase n=1 Tax=Streptomyces caniscabiei TaxID=2746961 RepID=UPI0009A12FA6|nr:class I SAM-dependent DNA methyltransferase [Streptomyces caniscabiei]
MRDTSDVTRRLWSLCAVLRDEGVTYHEYLNELTYLLFLKLAAELEMEDRLPAQCRWAALREQNEDAVAEFYSGLLERLGISEDPTVATIYDEAETRLTSGAALRQLIEGIDEIDWYRARQNGLGDVYEGLIEKNAQESRYGTGQYFTPRAVVDALVQALNPTTSDTVYDPAAGTAGFLVAAGLHTSGKGETQPRLHGVELVHDVRRMALMNLLLHGLQGEIDLGDSLSRDPSKFQASVCLTNPPFGVKGALSATQSKHMDFPTSNKQLGFFQHIYKSLAKGGRAAVVVPDNVLFEAGVASSIRTHLLDNYRLHTILRLPTGIFYATGIRTSVLFFCADGTTSSTWIYDLRSSANSFTKRKPLTLVDLEDFLACYGSDPLGRADRQETGRFKCVMREDLRLAEDRLDLVGKSEIEPSSDGPLRTPHDLAVSLLHHITAAQIAIGEVEEMLRVDSLRSAVEQSSIEDGEA